MSEQLLTVLKLCLLALLYLFFLRVLRAVWTEVNPPRQAVEAVAPAAKGKRSGPAKPRAARPRRGAPDREAPATAAGQTAERSAPEASHPPVFRSPEPQPERTSPAMGM